MAALCERANGKADAARRDETRREKRRERHAHGGGGTVWESPNGARHAAKRRQSSWARGCALFFVVVPLRLIPRARHGSKEADIGDGREGVIAPSHFDIKDTLQREPLKRCSLTSQSSCLPNLSLYLSLSPSRSLFARGRPLFLHFSRVGFLFAATRPPKKVAYVVYILSVVVVVFFFFVRSGRPSIGNIFSLKSRRGREERRSSL